MAPASRSWIQAGGTGLAPAPCGVGGRGALAEAVSIGLCLPSTVDALAVVVSEELGVARRSSFGLLAALSMRLSRGPQQASSIRRQHLRHRSETLCQLPPLVGLRIATSVPSMARGASGKRCAAKRDDDAVQSRPAPAPLPLGQQGLPALRWRGKLLPAHALRPSPAAALRGARRPLRMHDYLPGTVPSLTAGG
jgi:hypothetical protein